MITYRDAPRRFVFSYGVVIDFVVPSRVVVMGLLDLFLFLDDSAMISCCDALPRFVSSSLLPPDLRSSEFLMS